MAICTVACTSGPGKTQMNRVLRLVEQDTILTGAQQTELYLPLLMNKNTGLVCNHTSFLENQHLVDVIYSSGVSVRAIFTPEHGLRGDTEAGGEIGNSVDTRTGIPIISLYGNKKKPDPADLHEIDIMIFDIQDVGVRFYTYISTLALVMEACAELGIPLLVLDRPNPNGFYVDGPVLDTNYRSFVGMHPVPVVYGMTIGEYARMVNGEGWLKDGIRCNLTVIPLKYWDRNMIVRLPVPPSPNLPTWESIYLYPSLCLFEGTVISVGRGTEFPFQVIGHPNIRTGSYSFTPRIIKGTAENPPYLGVTCYGAYLNGFAEGINNRDQHFTLDYLLNYYIELNFGDRFFNNYFEKLAGNNELRQQVKQGLSEDEIRKTWEAGLNDFIKIREKYLLYPDMSVKRN